MNSMLPPGASPTGRGPEQKPSVSSPHSVPDAIKKPDSPDDSLAVKREPKFSVVPTINPVAPHGDRAMPKANLPQAAATEPQTNTGDPTQTTEGKPTTEIAIYPGTTPTQTTTSTESEPVTDKSIARPVYAATIPNPRKETVGKVGETSAGIQIIKSEGKKQIINKSYPDELVNPAVDAIKKGLPTSWELITPEGNVYENPETGQKIIVLTAESEESATSDIRLARRVERALDKDEAQRRVGFHGYAGIDASPALAATTLATGETIIAYDAPNGRMVTEDDMDSILDVIDELTILFRGAPQMAANITPADFRIEKLEHEEEFLHIVSRGFQPLEYTPKATQPAKNPSGVIIPVQRDTDNTRQREITPRKVGERTLKIWALLEEGKTPKEIHIITGLDHDVISRASSQRRKNARAQGKTLPDLRKRAAAQREQKGITANQQKGIETRARIEEAIARLSGGDPDVRPDPKDVANETGIPHRTVSRHMAEIFGPQHRNDTEQQTLISQARQIFAAHSGISLRETAKRLGISHGYLSTLLNRPESPEDIQE